MLPFKIWFIFFFWLKLKVVNSQCFLSENGRTMEQITCSWSFSVHMEWNDQVSNSKLFTVNPINKHVTEYWNDHRVEVFCSFFILFLGHLSYSKMRLESLGRCWTSRSMSLKSPSRALNLRQWKCGARYLCSREVSSRDSLLVHFLTCYTFGIHSSPISASFSWMSQSSRRKKFNKIITWLDCFT